MIKEFRATGSEILVNENATIKIGKLHSDLEVICYRIQKPMTIRNTKPNPKSHKIQDINTSSHPWPQISKPQMFKQTSPQWSWAS